MPTFAQNFRAWLKIADETYPQNVFGYVLQLWLGALRTDPFTLLPYDKPAETAKCGPGGDKSFLPPDLPVRDGDRPRIGKWTIPHRQVTQWTGPDEYRLLAVAMDELVAEHSSRVVIKTSVMEKAGDAIFIHDSIATPHAIAKATSREITHVHVDWEHSIHTLLSPVDCKEVITKKWGERMPLAGTLVPQEYLIIYTPRTTEEVAVVKSIVGAAIMFMTGADGTVGDSSI